MVDEPRIGWITCASSRCRTTGRACWA